MWSVLGGVSQLRAAAGDFVQRATTEIERAINEDRDEEEREQKVRTTAIAVRAAPPKPRARPQSAAKVLADMQAEHLELMHQHQVIFAAKEVRAARRG